MSLAPLPRRRDPETDRLVADFLAGGGEIRRIDRGTAGVGESFGMTLLGGKWVFSRAAKRHSLYSRAERARVLAALSTARDREGLLEAAGFPGLAWDRFVNRLEINEIDLPARFRIRVRDEAAPAARRNVCGANETPAQLAAFDAVRRGESVPSAARAQGLDPEALYCNIRLRFETVHALRNLTAESMAEHLESLSGGFGARQRKARVCICCRGARGSMLDRDDAKRMCATCDRIAQDSGDMI